MAADVDIGRGARERAARLRVSAHGAARGRIARRAAGGAASVGERACAARAGRAEVPARQPPAAAHARRRADGAGGRRSGGGRAARAGTVVALRHRGDGRAEGYLGARLPAVHERHQVDELGARAGDARASGRGGGNDRRTGGAEPPRASSSSSLMPGGPASRTSYRAARACGVSRHRSAAPSRRLRRPPACLRENRRSART